MMEQYEKLKRMEKKLDQTILKKHLQIEEQHNTRIFCLKRLRFFLKLKLVENNLHLRLDGRVINDYKNSHEMRTSELIKSLFVIVDEEACMNNNVIMQEAVTDDNRKDTNNDCKQMIGNENIYEWYQGEDVFDSFELIHKSIPKKIKIIINFDNSYDLVRLGPALQNLLKIHTTTKTNAIIEMWKYIRLNNLIDKNGVVNCDDALLKIFNVESFCLNDLTQKMNRHFLSLDVLAFDVPVSDYERVFDVVLERDDLTEMPILYKDKNICILDKKIQSVLECIEGVKDKKKTLEKFMQDPIKFTNEFLLIEKGDIDFLSGGSQQGFYSDPELQEYIYTFLKNE
ncbi:SWI/SNF and RSC complex subunit Ssr3 [Conglomerata obtusa]